MKSYCFKPVSKISKVIGPIGLFIFYIAIAFFIRSKFADTSSFVMAIEKAYANVGYPIIFLAGLLEGMFLIGLFVPGSVVLLMGAALSKIGIVEYPYVFILGTSGLILAYIVNYFLGSFGWYHVLSFMGLEKSLDVGKEKLTKHEGKTIMLGYFFPGSASILSTSAGILNMDFKKFLVFSILAQTFWSLVWGTISYFFGIHIVEFIVKYFIFVVLGGGAVWGVKMLIKR